MELRAVPLAKLNMVREAWRIAVFAAEQAGLADGFEIVDLGRIFVKLLDEEHERRIGDVSRRDFQG